MSDVRLKGVELAALIERVFQPRPEEQAAFLLVDLPDAQVPDNPAWADRREMVRGWVDELADLGDDLGRTVHLFLYRNAHMNNADLPEGAWLFEGGPLPARAEDLDPAAQRPFADIFAKHRFGLAPTEFSATAPLKLAARELGIRAATMPGFGPDMIPALRLDYVEINRRVEFMSDLLNRAEGAQFDFLLDGQEACRLDLDLRHRTAHSSGGLFPSPGQAGNLPSGESYIVPYEGELPGDPSGSNGRLPVQFEDGMVIYRIENNRAVAVEPGGAGEAGQAVLREADRLAAEPAYGNLAELGLGVLSDFGLEPIGETLLDEKLGLHIAFGRSDHFGGQVGAAQFSKPEAVVHIDRVFLPSIQPRIRVERVDLYLAGGETLALMRDGRYAVSF
jgi:hypothetical protein